MAVSQAPVATDHNMSRVNGILFKGLVRVQRKCHVYEEIHADHFFQLFVVIMMMMMMIMMTVTCKKIQSNIFKKYDIKN